MKMHVFDGELGWALSPGRFQQPHKYVGSDGSVHFDVVYSIVGGKRKTSASPRPGPGIVVARCSLTFGHGLNDADTWPWLLQEQLPAFSVTNVGTMAYGTDQSILAAQRVVEDPANHVRAVVIGFADFQIDRNRSAQQWMRVVYPFPKPMFTYQAQRVHSQGLVHFFTLGPFLDRSTLLAHVANRAANRYYRVPSHQDARAATVAMLREFGERLRARGTALWVVVLPWARDNSVSSRADREHVIQGLRASGVATVIPSLPRLPNGDLDIRKYMVSVEDRHPSRAYAEAVASQVAAALAPSLAKP